MARIAQPDEGPKPNLPLPDLNSPGTTSASRGWPVWTRFSLAGLATMVLLIASSTAVWVRWQPWELSSVVRRRAAKPLDPLLKNTVRFDFGENGLSYAPDGLRAIGNETATYIGYLGRLGIFDRTDPRTQDFSNGSGVRAGALCYLEDLNADSTQRIYYSWRFLENDRIATQYFEGPDAALCNALWVRRHPEWWWGHFFRPEVWATILLSAYWIRLIGKPKRQFPLPSGERARVRGRPFW